MATTIFKSLFFLGWCIYEFFLFAPHARRVRRARVIDARMAGWEGVFTFIAFAGMQVLPLFYVFSPWLSFADYHLPVWAGALGATAFAAALWITWRAHRDLGDNWTPALQVKEAQTLVTTGIYAALRHPIYLGQWLWSLAQVLLIQNWIAGLLGALCFLPVYLGRIRREERMMLDHFGEEYRAYMRRTGRIIPKLPRR